jgi:succinoglycan biosynthesis protein ExoW
MTIDRKESIGVVIPFFQRESGLLRRGLQSIFDQEVVCKTECRIRIAIVDDSSPSPATIDVDGLLPPENVEIILRKQANAGAGAARNAALDLLDDSVSTIAFLDSDDVWAPDHLTSALTALQEGADFYFCDATRESSTTSINADAPAWFRHAQRRVGSHSHLYSYEGPSDLVIVTGLVPTMSTIVHRHYPDPRVRFPLRYFRFGEDQYYSLRYLEGQRQIAYSSASEVICGRGVNIFSGNRQFSESERLCYLDELRFRRHALASLQLSPEARQHITRKLEASSRTVVRQGLWLALSGRAGWLARSYAAEPRLVLQTPRALVEVLREKRSAKTRVS